jgi:hypothetical protein
VLPSVIIIGAAKTGTTSLHHYLSQHPEIAMSEKKELRFFSHGHVWNRGVPWYESQFTGNAKLHGETSPAYSQYPRFPEVPRRIHELVPGVKLIYIVRDPIERLVSHYTFSVAKGRERGTLDDAVRSPSSRYVDISLYYTQVSRYLPYFDRSRILIVSSEDLQARRLETLQEVFRFLDVDDTFSSPAFSDRLNEAGEHRLRTATGLRIEQLNRLPFVKVIPRRWRIAAGRVIYRPFSTRATKPRLSDDLRRVLADRLRDDVNRFREWTGRPFAEWPV